MAKFNTYYKSVPTATANTKTKSPLSKTFWGFFCGSGGEGREAKNSPKSEMNF